MEVEVEVQVQVEGGAARPDGAVMNVTIPREGGRKWITRARQDRSTSSSRIDKK